ncbi:MAG: hypothetical protein CL930_01045 [Deltaproteobacteria bacterium]|nr:hypothetical protein [Deltaproteobacteria bacterium]
MLAGMLLLALSGPVWAGAAETWAAQYDARLTQAAGNDPSGAIAVYETLLAQMPNTDTMRGDVLYWLGRARWSAGDSQGARQSLESALEYRASKRRARVLLGRLAVAEKAIRSVPHKSDFRINAGPWVRGWERGQETDLTVDDGLGGGVLSWKTELVNRLDDFIIMGLDTDGDKVTQLSFRVQTDTVETHLRILVEDEEGQRWTAPLQIVEVGKWSQVRLQLATVMPAEAPAAEGRSLDLSAVHRVILRDVTAYHTQDRGKNTIFIDDFEIR